MAVVAGALAGAGCGGGDSGSSSEKPPKAAPDPAELAGRWWVWASGPAKPVEDGTGKRCTRDQPEEVFFLAGTFGGEARRTCRVPKDTPLFFPVLNRRCPTEGAPAEDAAAACGEGLEEAEVELTVDGEPARLEYVESPPFELEGESVAVGHHALLDPLPAGDHEIAFRGRDAGRFELDVQYRLTVE